MRRPRNTFPILLLAVVFTLSGPTATAETTSSSAVLGGEGELYRLIYGSRGEVTGAPDAPDADEPVMALVVRHADGTVEQALVPETEGPEIERSPFLIYENASRTLFVTWEERKNHIHSRIRLIGYRDGDWGEMIEVADDPFAFKGEPRLAATQDSFVVDGEDGEEHRVARTMLHVVWVEERGSGQVVAYAPLTLLDGQSIGERRIFDLSSMVPATDPGFTDLWSVTPPVVMAGDDDHSIVVGLVDSVSGRMASIRIGLLPGELAVVADELRSHLIDVGVRHDWQDPEGLRALADELRSHLIDVGHRLDPQILGHIADGLRSHLIDVGVSYPRSDVRQLADDLRSHLIDVGFRLDDRGLRQTSGASSTAVIEVVAASDPASGDAGPASQMAQLRTARTWPLPAEASADSVLLVSRSGHEALLAWEDADGVFYRETAHGEWGATRRLPIAADLDGGETLSLLHHRIRYR